MRNDDTPPPATQRLALIDSSEYESDSILVYTHPSMMGSLELDASSLLTCCICTTIPLPHDLLTFDCKHSLCQTCLTSLGANSLSPSVKCPVCRKQHLGEVKCSHFLTSILDGFPYKLVCGAEVTGIRVRKHISQCIVCLRDQNLSLREQMVSVVRCNDRMRENMELE